ncbi:DUF2529 family protein [Heyndrickxia sp. NPDC080065]|uniref:DUF2529 family protein n=1 Tax=Heyndrickxia sp. NPDC080065 TaxID=3390568 RepID=UPI003D00CFB1
MKMLLTQINGLFSRIYEKEQLSIEDSARLLAQAAIGEGKIYIKGFKEMEAIPLEAINGAEPMNSANLLTNVANLTNADRAIIISRFSNDSEAVKLAKELVQQKVPFTAISGNSSNDEMDLTQLADVHINTSILKPMLPTETGERTCFPSSMAALFIYHCIKLTFDEIIEEY